MTKGEIIFFFSFLFFNLFSVIMLLHNFEFLGHAPLTWGELKNEIWKIVVICTIGSLICTIEIQEYLRK